MPVTHELKCDIKWFNDTWEQRKLFEVRKNDRKFRVGDELHLREGQETIQAYCNWFYNIEPEVVYKYTGRSIRARINYVMQGGKYGLSPDYVVLGIEIGMWYDSMGCYTTQPEVSVCHGAS